MDKVPGYVSLIFILTTIATFGFIYFCIFKAQKKGNKQVSIISGALIVIWLAVSGFLAQSGFYLVTDSVPPRLFLTLGPMLATIVVLVSVERSRNFILNMPIATLTYLHIVRVPVEMVLWWMFLGGLVPELMTFEGINYDILSGVTAPFIAIFAVGVKKKRKTLAIIWNFIALGLLFNIVGHAILSAPTPFQKFAFEMPNVGVLYFPFVWLPAFIVPAVLFSHIASLLKLFQGEDKLN